MNYKDRVDSASSITPRDKYLWGYMYGLARDYMIPYLEAHGVAIKGAAVVEIGCAEGGNLCAMAEHGATELAGTDIAEERLEKADEIAKLLGLSITFSPHDIIGEPPPPAWERHFDVAFLRDVIEHLDDATIALRNIRKILKPGGALYVTFPPYYSPFGGHQHLLGNTAGKFPFMHLLPGPVFRPLIKSGIERNRIEVERLREIRMTTGKFHRAARDAGFTMADEKLYFIRPVFKMKFGLPPISANIIKPLPGLRDILALEAGYILKNG